MARASRLKVAALPAAWLVVTAVADNGIGVPPGEHEKVFTEFHRANAGGYEAFKSLHDIVVKERKLLTQQKWDEVFSFENLISPKFEQ